MNMGLRSVTLPDSLNGVSDNMTERWYYRTPSQILVCSSVLCGEGGLSLFSDSCAGSGKIIENNDAHHRK